MKIKAFTATFASNASGDVKSSDLVRLIHLLCDAHQPLHATPASPPLIQATIGGNVETVTPTNAATESLHAFWDVLLVDRLLPDQAISIAPSLPHADPIRAAGADRQIWSDESEAAAEESKPILDADLEWAPWGGQESGG